MGLSARTTRAFSTAALSRTGRLKFSTIGRPTPYVMPWLPASVQSSAAENELAARTVWNLLVVVTARPAGFMTVARTKYVVPGRRAHCEVQSVAWKLSCPATSWPSACTLTAVSRPSSAWTLTGTPGLTFTEPVTGVILTVGAGYTMADGALLVPPHPLAATANSAHGKATKMRFVFTIYGPRTRSRPSSAKTQEIISAPRRTKTSQRDSRTRQDTET